MNGELLAAARQALSALPVNVEQGVLTEPSLTVAKDHVIGTNPADSMPRKTFVDARSQAFIIA